MNKIKEIYLLFLIVIGLASLSVYSTYALFTASVEIDQVVKFETTISTDNSFMEYDVITLSPGDLKYVEVNVTNSYTDRDLYYGVWYNVANSGNTSDINIGTYTDVDNTTPSGRVSKNSGVNLVVAIQNISSNNVTVNLGSVGSETSNLGLQSPKILVPVGFAARTKKISLYIGNKSSAYTLIQEIECSYRSQQKLPKFSNVSVFPNSSEDKAQNGNSDYYWKFYGWAKDDPTGTVRTYVDEEVISCDNDKKLYAIGYKNFKFYAPDTSKTPAYPAKLISSSQNQYWNPYSTTSYLTKITLPSAVSLNCWTFNGFKGWSDAADSEYRFAASTVGTSVTPAYDADAINRSMYKRTLTLAYNANGASGSISSVTGTQYYNSGISDTVAGKVNSVTKTLASSGFTKSGMVLAGWTLNGTSGTSYSLGQSFEMAPAVNDCSTTFTMEPKFSDDNKPVCSISASTNSCTKGPITLTMTVTDSSGSLASSPYSWDNSSWSSTKTKSVSANGTYYGYGKDSAGNVSDACSINISKIDNEKPECSISGNPTTWTVPPIGLTIIGEDNCGLASSPYSYLDGSSWTSYSSTPTFSVNANATYSARVKDAAGNVSDNCSVRVEKIPPIPECKITGNPTSWTNNDVTLTVSLTNADDGVTLASSPYSWTSNTSGFGTTATNTVSANGTYTAYVKSNAGYVGSCSVEVTKIDQKAPTCSVTGNPSSWQKTDATLTVSGVDEAGDGSGASGLASSPYSWTSKSSGFSTTQTKTVSANGTYTAYVKDAVGNVAECPTKVTKIDKTKPTRSWSKSDETAWCPGVYLSVTCSDEDGGSGIESITMNDAGTVSTGTSTTGQYLNSVRDGSNKATSVTCVDKAGNSSTGTRYYIVRNKVYKCSRPLNKCTDGWTSNGEDHEYTSTACYKKSYGSCTQCSSYTSSSTCTAGSNTCIWRQSSCTVSSSGWYLQCGSCPSSYPYKTSGASSYSTACYKYSYSGFNGCSVGSVSGSNCVQKGQSSCSSGWTATVTTNCST